MPDSKTFSHMSFANVVQKPVFEMRYDEERTRIFWRRYRRRKRRIQSEGLSKMRKTKKSMIVTRVRCIMVSVGVWHLFPLLSIW